MTADLLAYSKLPADLKALIAQMAMQQADLAGAPITYLGAFADSYDNTAGIDAGSSTNEDVSVAGQVSALSGGIDSFAELVLHMDGTDGSTTFTDSSASAHTVTANGNAQVDTAQSVFGGASGLFDGTGDFLSIPDSDDWHFGTGDFTIDCRVRYNSVGIGGIVGQNVDANNYWVLYRSGGGAALTLTAVTGGSTVLNLAWSWTPSTATWYHVAVTRSGNDWRAFINGAQIGSTLVDADAFPNYAAPLRIGEHAQTAGFNGWIDELRISKGIARWTANFTPPAAAYATGYENLTLVSSGVTLPVEPTVIELWGLRTDNEAVAENTDFIAAASIDDGSTYAVGTIEDVGLIGSLTLWHASVDVSAQTGTTLRIKQDTANNKNLVLNGVFAYAAA